MDLAELVGAVRYFFGDKSDKYIVSIDEMKNSITLLNDEDFPQGTPFSHSDVQFVKVFGSEMVPDMDNYGMSWPQHRDEDEMPKIKIPARIVVANRRAFEMQLFGVPKRHFIQNVKNGVELIEILKTLYPPPH